jgi:hypothetical protein
MTLQRHTGSHSVVPPLQPVADAPRAPDAATKKPAEAPQGQPCQADRETQD